MKENEFLEFLIILRIRETCGTNRVRFKGKKPHDFFVFFFFFLQPGEAINSCLSSRVVIIVRSLQNYTRRQLTKRENNVVASFHVIPNGKINIEKKKSRFTGRILKVTL